MLRNELKAYNPEMLEKPEIVVINKSDLLISDSNLIARLRKDLSKAIAQSRPWPMHDEEPWVISAVSGDSLHRMVEAAYKLCMEQKIQNSPNAPKFALPDSEKIRK